MVIKAPLSEAGIDSALRKLEEYRAQVLERTMKLVERLADIGVIVASVDFRKAQYDGVNDVTVTKERGDNYAAIVATGNAVLFIEFGTGVYYPNSHPDAVSFGYVHGGYGYGLGKLSSWRYHGQPGSSGEYVTTDAKGDVYRTHGNPANMCMYSTEKYLESIIRQTAREVFR